MILSRLVSAAVSLAGLLVLWQFARYLGLLGKVPMR